MFLDYRDAGFDVGEERVLGGFGADVDFGVISMTAEVQVELADDVTKGEEVKNEERGLRTEPGGTPCLTGDRVDEWPERERNCWR